MKDKFELQLDSQFVLDIMDNCFGNIFVVDNQGRVVFINQNCVTAFGCPREDVIGRTTEELVETGILTRSTSQECLETQETIIGTVKSQIGYEMLNISRPVFDDNGKLSFIMTYGQRSDSTEEFLKSIENERRKANNYKEALQRISEIVTESDLLIVEDESVKLLYDKASNVATTDSTIMIYGESGVGKDVLANYIHRVSLRKDEPFIPVNCAAIPRDLIESEFFGYVKGAFTGANSNGKPGLFELANKGTLFLDEIGEMPLEMQAKFLRAIETGMITRIGGQKAIKTDVRIIAATNRRLEEMVREKKFREDLYFRLNVISFYIPPLRERPKDLESLTHAFLDKYNKKYSKNVFISSDTMQRFVKYRWAGNIRELKNVVERIVLTGDSEFEDALSLDFFEGEDLSEASRGVDISSNFKDEFYHRQKERVLEVLVETNGNKTKAAQILGMSKGKLYKIINEN